MGRIALILMFLASPVMAERAITEGKPSTLSAILVSSNTSQVSISTNVPYSGSVPNVGLWTTSNTVIGNCVFYSSGSTTCSSIVGTLIDPTRASTGTCNLPLVMTAGLSGNVTCQEPSDITGNAAGTAAALAAAGSAAGSGYLCRGVDASGNCLPAAVPALSVPASTSPAMSGDLDAVKVSTGINTVAIAGLQAWQSTMSPHIEISDVWMSTISPVVERHEVWQSTISPVIAGKAAAGANDDITSMSALRAITAELTSNSTTTINGKDSAGYSLKLSSGISMAAGVIQVKEICYAAGGCQVAPPGGGTIGGSGTAGKLPYFSAATTLADSQIVRDGATSLTVVGATVTFSSAAFTAVSPSVPGRNTLYSDNLPKAWVNANINGTFNAGFNIASVGTCDGTGHTVITFTTPFANAYYACSCMANYNVGNGVGCYVTAIAADSMTIQAVTGHAAACWPFMLICFGAQ